DLLMQYHSHIGRRLVKPEGILLGVLLTLIIFPNQPQIAGPSNLRQSIDLGQHGQYTASATQPLSHKVSGVKQDSAIVITRIEPLLLLLLGLLLFLGAKGIKARQVRIGKIGQALELPDMPAQDNTGNRLMTHHPMS